MSISDVTVTISVQKPTPVLGGFGKPLIISSGTGRAYTNYTDIEAVAADYPGATEEYKAAAALFAGANPPKEVAIAQHATEGEGATLDEFMNEMLVKDWHFVISTSTLIADITAIGDKIEADKSRQYIARTGSKTDLATIRAKGYDRTAVIYHTDLTHYPDAAWVGAVGSLPVGSATWKGWTLTGIAPLDISATELTEIHSLGANTYLTKAGTPVTSEGKAVSGEFIDFIHSKDYIVYSVEYAVQDLFNQAQATNSKIPYDNRGIAQIESAVRTVLQRAYLNGMIAADDNGVPLYSTTFPPRSEVDPAQIAARNYPDGKFDFVIAGAVHTAVISGTIKFA